VVSRPALWERLGASARVTVVSAPPGSGKTVLLRSWIGAAGLGERAAWVPVGRDERDPQRFWLAVLGALRQTSAGSGLVRELTAAPDLDGWAIVERLLADHWPTLYLDGQAGTTHELLAGFPAEARAPDAELAAVAAADELAQGSLEAAERYLGLAERGLASVPAGRRGQALVLLGVVRLLLARQQLNLPELAEQAQRLQAAAEAPEAAQPGLGEELRALALVSLGITEVFATRLEGQRHLEQGLALARRIGRPYLEFTGLAYQAVAEFYWSFPQTADRSMRAIELAREHGWTDEPTVGIAYMRLGSVLAWQGRPEEAEPWVQHAERTIRAEAEPAAAFGVHHIRGVLELARGRDADALAAFRAAGRLAGRLAAPHLLATAAQTFLVYTPVRLGDTERAEQALAGLGEHDRDRGEMRIATAHAALIAQILDLLAGNRPARRPPGRARLWSRSATARSACCATCRLTCRRRRSPASCPSRPAPSRPTCATCTASSARTAGPERSSPPAPWACSRPPHARLRPPDRIAKRSCRKGGLADIRAIMGYAAGREFAVRCWRRSPWYGRSCFPSGFVRAAGGGGAGDGGVGAAGQRQDGAAAVLDQRIEPGRAGGVGAGGTG
jgi:hypothetical protein